MKNIPNKSFYCEFEVNDALIDHQGRVSNDRMVYLISKAANLHSEFLSWTVKRYEQLGSWWVVSRHEIDYKSPAKDGDTLGCYTWISELTAASAIRNCVIFRKTDETVIVMSKSRWAMIDVVTSRPKRIPDILRDDFRPIKVDQL